MSDSVNIITVNSLEELEEVARSILVGLKDNQHKSVYLEFTIKHDLRNYWNFSTATIRASQDDDTQILTFFHHENYSTSYCCDYSWVEHHGTIGDDANNQPAHRELCAWVLLAFAYAVRDMMRIKEMNHE